MAHVLVADDEADLRLLLRINFEAVGHRVTLAADGREAVHQVAAGSPDLVVLDLMMPVLDGWGVLRALRERGDEVAVIVASAKHDRESLRRAYEAGADGHVGKPFELDALLGSVEVHLGRSVADRRAARAAALATLAD